MHQPTGPDAPLRAHTRKLYLCTSMLQTLYGTHTTHALAVHRPSIFAHGCVRTKRHSTVMRGSARAVTALKLWRRLTGDCAPCHHWPERPLLRGRAASSRRSRKHDKSMGLGCLGSKALESDLAGGISSMTKVVSGRQCPSFNFAARKDLIGNMAGSSYVQ